MAPSLTLLLALTVALHTTNTKAWKQIYKRQSQQPSCSANSDVVFLLDSSDAVGQDDYQRELDFVKDTVNRLDVGPNRVQVGLATFGSQAQSVFNLNQHQTDQEVIQALSSAPMVGGTSNMQEALRFTTDNMFTPQAGVGSQTSHIVVMVTNGHSQNPDLTILQGTTAQNNDIQIYTVGVGAGINEAELKGVASDPDTRYFYKADTFAALQGLDDILGPKICNEVPKDPSFLPAPTGCLQKADVVFLLDSSSSIGKDNFHKLEDFLKDVVQDLNISPDGVHVGLMQYSSYPSLEFSLGMHTSRYDALKAIDAVTYMGGGANTADALDYMRRLVFSQNSEARPGVPRIAVVITDGSSPNSGDVAIQANNARLDNIGLLAVGVGPNMNTAELQAIADDPDSQHMFTVSDYDQLPSITHQLIDATCTVQSTAAPMGTSGSSGTGTLPPDPCQDKLNCANYADDVCTLYVEWSKDNCQRTCGFCQPLYTPPPPKCEDVISNCESYGVASCAGTYLGWAQQNCQRYCGYCGLDTLSLGYHGQCSYKGKTYNTGETWMDCCDYECTCEDGNTGKYRCYNRCPIYHDLPSQCTLVKDPDSCCLQPKCNFNQLVNSIQGSTVGHVKSVATCEYKGAQYFGGQQWQDGCDYKCTCVDANTGHYECQELCPTYPNLPSYCHMEKNAGSCCAKPVCEFNMQQGTFTGMGSVSGNGIDSLPPTLPPCVDALDNCPMYGKPSCSQYRNWALTNCRRFCELCDVDRVPGPEDVCLYNGKQYHQGESWFPSCNMRCTCEKATQGYFRCDDLCPTYTNVPATCQMVKPAGACCSTLQCGSGTFISSANNLNTIGNGGNVYVGANYVPPTLITGVTAPPGTGDTVNHASAIPGCLYKGEVYVQGQNWNDECTLSCMCEDATTGRYKCRNRCPQYVGMPAGCQLVVDESDTCCTKPLCTGPDAAHYVPMPTYGQYQSQSQVAQPPTQNQRYTGTNLYVTPHSNVATVVQHGTTVPPPSAGTGTGTGGIGYCNYKGKTYQPNDRWEDGCDYNCICDDASIGHYTCVDKCVVYQINSPFCHLVTDPLNSCCQIPNCTWTAPYGQVTGLLAIQPTTVAHTYTQPPTPGFAFCVYNGTHYDRNQIWYQGCDFKCTCENPETNNYRCVSRCAEYENLDPSCTFEPDPNDPGCCSVPRCGTPTPNPNIPNPTQGAITVVPGFVTGDNFPPGATTGGPNKGVCEYNDVQYHRGETWEDGCQYNCVCEDEVTGKYKCTEKCTRYDYIPPNCRLVSDFTNPCCQIMKCDLVTSTPTPGTTIKPNPNGPHQTQAPTPNPNAFCVYQGVSYRQDEEWMDGCDKKCRCDNADTGVYTCTQRCMTYDSLPPECKLVTDPHDQCCLVPQCAVPTAMPFVTPPPNGPAGPTLAPQIGDTAAPGKETPHPGLYPTPTAVPGKVTGMAQHPTPTIGPNGEKPTPVALTYCEYKGAQYQQGDTWQDGCQFNCECVNALTGKYECTERCARYTNLPAECRLVKNPADPCCEMPECGPAPTTPPPPITASPPIGQTVTPVPNPHGTTLSPNLPTTVKPSTTPTDVCVYKGKAYSQGQHWYDGCDYQCVCENGPQGLYTCNDRCPTYQSLPEGCTMVADPNDPFCCKTPECTIPPKYANSSGYILPTPPLAIISGGSATPLPTPPNPNQHPTTPSTVAPIPGQPTQAPTTPAPTIPNNVCVYNGRAYQQGQTWRDGCNYNCRCEDAQRGHYVCTEICPKNPPSLPANCRLIRDVNQPCCQIPYCEATTPPPPTTPPTAIPPTGPNGQPVTVPQTPPPTGPNGQPVTNPPTPPGPITTVTPTPASYCVYNGVNFKQGQTWDDGCDLKCVCENSATGYYRCNQRCARYDHVPAGCVLMADPRDSCCQVPVCQPVKSTPPPTLAPTGPTLVPPPTLPPGETTTTPVPILIPTAIPGKVEGVGVTPTPGQILVPNPNNPFTTPAPTMAPGCLYKGVVHTVAEGTWDDGCQYECVCLSDQTGRYSCTEKCPLYPSLPPNCQLVNDPSDPCCKKPQCVTNPLVVPTAAPTPPQTGPTINPPDTTPLPQPTPVLREVCRYMGKTYTQGQQWDDGCQKVCVCEDAKTGFYRCSDRCVIYDNIPAGCTLVPDPNDPTCCEIPQCTPTPNPSFPNPTPGPTELVTQPVGKVTGIAPAPTPTPHPGESTQTPQPGCYYKGMLYRQNQRWQDGCDFNCVCVNEMSGAYSCTQRCPSIGHPSVRCHVEPDPSDFCCVRQVCDYSKPVPSPVVPEISTTTTPRPSLPPGSTYAPTQAPPPSVAPQTTPPPVCVYNGIPYGQGVSWKEGCSRTCRCEDAANNIYTCSDRCPTYELQPGCHLVTSPSDPCCQVPQCLVTPQPTPQPTPFPNGSYPNPDFTPSKGPGLLPVLSPSPVPSAIPGILTGTLPTPTGFCEYKGGRYSTGQSWSDGCDYNCVCVDDTTGQYRCTERCPPYPSIPPYCYMVRDPGDQCCEKPYCPGLQPPTTQSPAPQSTPTGVPPTQPPTPPTGITPSAGSVTLPPPSTTTPATFFPTFFASIPTPTGDYNPVPRDVCQMNGKTYTQGQQWYDGCQQICVCEDGKTGFYNCRERCPTYLNVAPDCILAPDPKDPLCCKAPQCTPPTNINTPPKGVLGQVEGYGLPPTPTPSPGAPIPTQEHVCVYKGSSYTTGQHWQDGCDLNCECVDDMTGEYKCTDRCERFPNLPTYCVLVYDPNDPCCKKPLCGDMRPIPTTTPAPTAPNGDIITPPPGAVPTTPNPNAFCVYNGVAYRQGQSWDVGCDKVCRCENAMMRHVTCTDRCPSYPSVRDGCVLKTDPQDSCCQVLDCPPKINPDTHMLVPPLPPVVTGKNEPPPQGIPNFVNGGSPTCVYNGVPYNQGQSWDDGCTYSCVCVDANEGKYICSEKCPRFDNLPATCTLVQDTQNPCCKSAFCPDLKPPTTVAPNPNTASPGTTPVGQTPTTPPPTPAPEGVCVYGNNYYKQGQMWFDGCEKRCVCEDTTRNFYRCDQRCSKYDNVPAECRLVADPQDPTCCEIPECPLSPTRGTTSGYVKPDVTPPTGLIVGSAPIPTPTPTQHPGDTTPQPLPATGCYYKNQAYSKGQTWDDGCDYTCECLDDMTGAYRCTDKCPPQTNSLPDPNRCRLVRDPNNPCCPVPYCDFEPSHPQPVFPTPPPTPSPGPNGELNFWTQPTIAGTKPPGFCVYQGVYYRQGDEWSVGCSQRCRCEDVENGYYSCFERCKSYDNLPSTCTLKADPADPCCVIPDCNEYPVPGLPQTTGPNGETPPPTPSVVVVPVGTGSYTGVGGNNPIGLNSGSPFIGSNRKECVYKSVAYSQGQRWEDGCAYKCECIDAVRGQFRCDDRCPAYNFLPPDCHYEQDPNDQCCQLATCNGSPAVTGTKPPPPTPGVITIGQERCVYRDGKQYMTGDTWTDGCQLSCKCEDQSVNKYTCTQRCPVFSSLPDYCHLIKNPDDNCCLKAECTGRLVPLVGSNKPTASPFLPANITNIVPLGTHTVIRGRAPMSPGYTGPALIGHRNACVYKNQAYVQGQVWDDGCDYVCTCEDELSGEYKCTSKCPKMPPLPAYCKEINIPGQCCPSISCKVPDHGTYNPTPELTAQNVPTPAPGTAPGTGTTPNPQIIVVGSPNVIAGGTHLPGGGAAVPPNTIVGSLEGKCVTDDLKMYNPGETWQQGCDYNCECIDGRTGYYNCSKMCTDYSNIPSQCTIEKEGCCDRPVCTADNGTLIDIAKHPEQLIIFPMTATKTGGYTSFRPGFLAAQGNSFIGQGKPGCLYKGVTHDEGTHWDDGCDFTCTCEDGAARQFVCKPKCSRYQSIPRGCKLVKDPQQCCDMVDCTQLTTINPKCRDPLDNCEDYGQEACVDPYLAWAESNCPYYCGLKTCGGEESTTTTPAPPCADKLSNCVDYTKDSCVGQYLPWAKENCAAFCGLCHNATSAPTGSSAITSQCHDLLPDCRSYGTYSCQAPYLEWAKINCNYTCGLCSQVVGAGTHGFSGNSTGPGVGVTAGPLTEIHTHSEPGWTILMKGVAGVPNDDLYRLWASSETRNANNSIAMRPTADFLGNYKPALSNFWDTCKFDQVKVAVWNQGQEKAWIVFDARGASKMNWFDQSRIVSSSYTDLKGSQPHFFSMQGDVSMGREFYINKDASGCAGSGWIMVSTQSTCFYERGTNKPAFYYAAGSTAGSLASRQEGDVFLISGHGGTCTGMNTTDGKPVCNYKGTDYLQGAKWQDGCEKNCTCIDANLGYYQCDTLCQRFSSALPQGCHLTKAPGACCETLECGGEKSGCYYKGHYYRQSEEWTDGCDYRCKCEQASTGFYTCRTRCVTWNLPDECYLATPEQGKCCPKPVCPAGFVITYPAGYTEE